GLVPPFTALTGAFGEGEGGPARQPRHPYSVELATALLDAGADPNDGQALYNRMFTPDDDWLALLFRYGLGRVPSGGRARPRCATTGTWCCGRRGRAGRRRWSWPCGSASRWTRAAGPRRCTRPPGAGTSRSPGCWWSSARTRRGGTGSTTGRRWTGPGTGT